MKRRRRSVFTSLTALFIALEIITLTGASLLLLRYGRIQEEMSRQQIDSAIEDSLAQAEENIAALYRMASSLGSDTRLAEIAYEMYPNEYQRSRLVLSLLDTFRGFCDVNSIIEDIEVVFNDQALRLSNSGGYDNSYTPRENRAALLTDYLMIEGEKLTVCADHPLGTHLFGDPPDYEVRISLSRRFIENALDRFSDADRQGAFLILDRADGEAAFTIPLDENRATSRAVYAAMAPKGAEQVRTKVCSEGHRYRVTVARTERLPLSLVVWHSADALTANMVWTLASIGALTFVVSALFLLLIHQTNRRVARPLYRLMEAFDAVRAGRFETRIRHDMDDEFARLYDSFNSMCVHSEKLISDMKEQRGLLQSAEFMQLQAQIDPHFLYNSFNNIKYLAHCEEYDQIIAFVSALADYYRFINKETRQMIPLSAEVRHMQTYLYIQQMRFEERIRVDVGELPPGTENLPVPKLILQPLVENCYLYGIHDKLADGLIRVRFAWEERWLTIRVADNGDDMSEEKVCALRNRLTDADEETASHALANIRRRLELLYGAPDLLSLALSDLGGLEVTLRLDASGH